MVDNMLKSARKKYGPAGEAQLMGYLAGELTEKAVAAKLATIVGSKYRLVDGHDPFTAPNFGAHMEIEPKNLDVVQLDRATGNVVAIYEVKSTTDLEKREFNVNGQCGIFMARAVELGIPTFLIVVRLERRISEDVLRKELATGKVSVNPDAYMSELDHIARSSKVELYGADQFKMEAGKFVVSGAARTLESIQH